MKPRGTLLLESTMPSYMTLSLDEMSSIFESFLNIFKTIWSSVKLLTSTLVLNMKVVAGSMTNDRAAIQKAFEGYEEDRREYDREMVDNLKYFKKYYVESRFDTLGGFGPKVLAFAANPLIFVSSEVSAATVSRGTMYTAPEVAGASVAPTRSVPGSVRITPRLRTALDFFEYDASRLSEAATPELKLPKQATEEMRELQSIARSFIDDERRRAGEILKMLAGRMSSIKKVVESKTFDELLEAMKEAEKNGIKMFGRDVKVSKDKIQSEFEKQIKEDPKKFKEAVKLMKQKAPEITETDDLEVAMKFIFGVTKSSVQKQLMNSYDKFLREAKASLKLPIDMETQEQLRDSEMGKEYLAMLKNFESDLETGKKQAVQVKNNFKSSIS